MALIGLNVLKVCLLKGRLKSDFMISKKSKPESLSTLIKQLDTVFSTYIRLRDSNEQGTVTCFVSGEKVFWKEAQAAHFIPRANMVMRFCESNVHACTKESNQYDPDHDDQYRLKMVEKYGLFGVGELIIQSKSLQKWTRSEILDLIDLYTDKVKELRKQKYL